jgi:hypothetical protein
VVVDGPHIGYCAVCEIRNCGVQKKVENCAYCIEYGCGKLETVHSRSSEAKDTLEQIRKQIKEKGEVGDISTLARVQSHFSHIIEVGSFHVEGGGGCMAGMNVSVSHS